MFRTSVLALAAAAALGSVALTPGIAAADRHGWRHSEAIADRFEHRERAGDRFDRRERFEDRFAHRDADDCFRPRQVWTPWGWTWRRIWVCG